MCKYLGLWLTVCIFCLGFFSDGVKESIGAEPTPSKNQSQIEVSIVHVDKYGVYAPNIVFYWDTQMSKQKIDMLTSVAEKMRNNKVLITYSSKGDLETDKRPLLMDIVPSIEKKMDRQVDMYESEDKKLTSAKDRLPDKGLEDRQKQDGKVVIADDLRNKSNQTDDKYAYYSTAPSGYVSFKKEDVIRFIDFCIDATTNKNMASIMSCYGDRVDYYSNGVVDKDGIRRDKLYYLRQWDRIDSSVEGDIVVIVTDQENVRIAKFISRFSVENAKKSIKGRAENVWKIQRTNNAFKIIDEKQKIISRDQG